MPLQELPPLPTVTEQVERLVRLDLVTADDPAARGLPDLEEFVPRRRRSCPTLRSTC